MLRLALKTDAPQLVPIINTAYRKQGGWTTEAGLVAGERINEEQLIHVIESEHEHLYVYEHESKVRGCICLEKYDPQAFQVSPTGSSFLLGLFAVDPALQGKGIGKKLVQHCESVSRDFGVKTLYMWVLESRNEILSWYARMGYHPTGEKKPFVFPDLLLQQQDFVILSKDLQ
ncbi:acyl-CoA N-acyltransferase [Gorgonomyces haynaldii]|nr:acyl-CoA N-acyltransferase [Gorgonomyces haynaldii]